MQRTSTSHGGALRAVAIAVSICVMLNTVGILAAPSPAGAAKKTCNLEDLDCDPGGEPDGTVPYQGAKVDLTYKLVDRVGGWKQAWRSRDDNKSKPWHHENYDPRYVFPSSFTGTFGNQCIDKIDFDKELNEDELTVNTYRWRVNGITRSFRSCFRTNLAFPGEGLHSVRLDVLSPGGTTLVTKQRSVRVKDHLVVLFGDSMASGEGAPEHKRKKGDEFGTWIDRRCHRSSWAAVPKAVEQLEAADPFTTVTFLNFACSGATLGDWVPGQGSGVLGPYNGIEPPVEFDAEDEANDPSIIDEYLPSQVDQLARALGVKSRFGGQGAPDRTVDKLFVSAGINDVRFAELSVACVVETECIDQTTSFYGGQTSVGQTMSQLAASIPHRWQELDEALEQKGVETVPGSRYAMEYPDAFTNSNGGLCSAMLTDVLPQTTVTWVLSVLLPVIIALIVFLPTAAVGAAALLALTLGISAVGIALEIPNIWNILFNGAVGDLEWAADEIAWLSSTGNALLGDAVIEGAQLGGFTHVDGIADLFIGHGYCADDNWLNTARESSYLQGPYDFLSMPLGLNIGDDGVAFGLDIHARTKGLVHPNRTGYAAVADRLADELDDLIVQPPVATGDGYFLDLSTSKGLTVPAWQGLLANDTDGNGDVLKVATSTQPTHGSVTVKTDGSFTYIPDPNFEGWDSFTYRATDGWLLTQQTTVAIHVLDTDGPDWSWTIPQDLEVELGSSITFPVCKDCAWLDLWANPGPTMGSIEMERIGPDWEATYTPKSSEVPAVPTVDHLVFELREAKDIGVYVLRGAAEVAITIVADEAVRWTYPTPASTLTNTQVEFELCTGCGHLEPLLDPQNPAEYGTVEFVRVGGVAWNVVYQPNPELSSFATYQDHFGVQLLDGDVVVDEATVEVHILGAPR